MSDGQWYWCLVHHAVEPYDACKSADRLGPYATRDEAANALERVKVRNEQWDNDPRFNDEDDDGEQDEDERWPSIPR